MRKEVSNGKESGEKEAIRQQGNPNKEPVAEAMTRKNFYTLLAAVNNTISTEEVRVYTWVYTMYTMYTIYTMYNI